MAHPNQYEYEDDYERSGKNIDLAKPISAIIGAFAGSAAGLVIGAIVGGPLGALLGLGVGICMGALLGYLIATASTYSSRPRVRAFSQREAGNEEPQSESYPSKMGPLLETSNTDGEPQAEFSEAQALDFRKSKPSVSDLDQTRETVGTNMSF